MIVESISSRFPRKTPGTFFIRMNENGIAIGFLFSFGFGLSSIRGFQVTPVPREY
jgi:hypothetical protein